MVLIHKYFKLHSLKSVSSSNQLLIAASCVFLVSKVLYMPISLEKAVEAFFSIEKRLNNKQLMRATLSKEREAHYREIIETMESNVLYSLGFDLDLDLPYNIIRTFCEKYADFASRDSLYQIAFKFCNDSFKLPLCLFFHPKILAAAFIQMAALWRKKQGCDTGLTLIINGHPWYKWIDSAIEQSEINQVINHMRQLYMGASSENQRPVAPVNNKSSEEISSTSNVHHV